MHTIPLDDWIEQNASGLGKDIQIHIRTYAAGTNLEREDADEMLRMIFTSIRQWAGELEDKKYAGYSPELKRINILLDEVKVAALKWANAEPHYDTLPQNPQLPDEGGL